VNIGQTSGYGEYFKGLLNGTYGFVDLGSLTWYHPNDSIRFMAIISNIKLGMNGLCSSYPLTSTKGIDKTLYMFDGYYGNRRIAIFDSDYTDVATFKTAMSGVYLIYELATPVTPTITPEQFATLCQAFGITGNTYAISFGQTVYSANLDVLNGILSITHELKTIDENSDIQRADNGILYLNSFFEIGEDTESVNCNVYQRGENRGTVAQVNANNPDLSFCCKLGTNTDRIMIKDTRFTSVEDYKTWLSTNPVKIAVKLAQPIEVQLTPTQIITTLIGENVIFADVADVTECKYTRK
jgi:hypothetical protein